MYPIIESSLRKIQTTNYGTKCSVISDETILHVVLLTLFLFFYLKTIRLYVYTCKTNYLEDIQQTFTIKCILQNMEDRLDTVVPAPNLITCVERLLVEPLLHVMVNSVGLTLVYISSFPSVQVLCMALRNRFRKYIIKLIIRIWWKFHNLSIERWQETGIRNHYDIINVD